MNKKIIFYFLIALAVLFPIKFVFAQWEYISLYQYGLPGSHIETIIQSIMYWLLGIFSTVAIIAFAISGFQYLTAAGDEGRMETAKKHMVYSIIGVIVGLSGLIIIYAVFAALSAMDSF